MTLFCNLFMERPSYYYNYYYYYYNYYYYYQRLC